MVLSVSFDTPAENNAFTEKFGFNFPLICDTDRKIGAPCGANVDPRKGAACRLGHWQGRHHQGVARQVDARSWPAPVVQTL